MKPTSDSLDKLERLLSLLRAFGITHYKDEEFTISLGLEEPKARQLSAEELSRLETERQQAQRREDEVALFAASGS